MSLYRSLNRQHKILFAILGVYLAISGVLLILLVTIGHWVDLRYMYASFALDGLLIAVCAPLMWRWR